MAVSFSQATYSVDEGGSVTVTVELSADPERQVVVPITATNQNGASNSDYSGVPGSVTFTAGDRSATFTLRAVDDSVDDDDESVLLGFGARPDRVSAGAVTAAVVSIVDDDHPRVAVSFSRATYSVDEGGSVTVEVGLDADPERTVRVPITAANLGGADAGDYTLSPATVTFNSGDRSATFTLRAVDDSVDDDDESVLLGFGALPDRVSPGSPSTAAVNLIDNDHPRVAVSFAQATYSVTEGDDVTITVNLDKDPERTVEVDITATNRDGADSGDYTVAPTTVTFGAAETSATFTFTAVDDDIDDDDESVLLGFPATLPDRVSAGTDTTAAVAIGDNDDPEVAVSFARAAYSVTEGGSVTVTVTLDADPERTVVVPITATGQGDASDSDYSGVPGSVTFTRGDRSESFTFTAADDDVDDDGESVRLGFPATLPDRVSAGTNATATVNIEDDDDPEVAVSFAQDTYSVDEGRSVTITVTLDKPIPSAPWWCPSPPRARTARLTRTIRGCPAV